eukprot:TRINITY_DN181_c0_g2_i10.p2 TRINITY_DN181_c0_g2~~TRINITY_DN181_c0_g2_i10.p2  ORF type:complete len:366 (+),score=79.01 TRINITY_DN181_c0_g2_i10:61-1158(+)
MEKRLSIGSRRHSISLSETGVPRRRSFAEILRGVKSFGSSSVALSDMNISINALTMTNSAPSPRCNHSATIVDNKMVVFGGRDLHVGTYFGGLHVLDLDTMEWSEPPMKGDAPSPRALHTATLSADGKAIFIIGGSNELKQLDDVYVLYCDTWTFELLSRGQDFPGGALAGHSTTLINGLFLYVIGGRQSDCERASSSVHSFNIATRTWTKVETTNQMIPRAAHTATLLSSRGGKEYIVIYGGKNGDSNVDEKFILFDVVDHSWNRLESSGKSPGKPRMFHATVIVGSVFLIIGGKRETSDDGISSTYAFDLETSCWRKFKQDEHSSFKGRYGHTAVYYNRRVYIFGGCHNRKCFNDLHILSIAA